MKETKRGKSDGKAEARRLAQLIERTIDEGADTVEEIHRAIASMPLDVLGQFDVFKETVKDVRKAQDISIGALYALIHKVNREVGNLATEILRRRSPRRTAPRRATSAAASAHAR